MIRRSRRSTQVWMGWVRGGRAYEVGVQELKLREGSIVCVKPYPS